MIDSENGLNPPVGSVVITGVPSYEGCRGRIVRATAMMPSWPIVQLDDGRRLVVHPARLMEQREKEA
jgi:hypothetical protein